MNAISSSKSSWNKIGNPISWVDYADEEEPTKRDKDIKEHSQTGDPTDLDKNMSSFQVGIKDQKYLIKENKKSIKVKMTNNEKRNINVFGFWEYFGKNLARKGIIFLYYNVPTWEFGFSHCANSQSHNGY